MSETLAYFNPLNPGHFISAVPLTLDDPRKLVKTGHDLQQNPTMISFGMIANVLSGLYLVSRTHLWSKICPINNHSNKYCFPNFAFCPDFRHFGSIFRLILTDFAQKNTPKSKRPHPVVAWGLPNVNKTVFTWAGLEAGRVFDTPS